VEKVRHCEAVKKSELLLAIQNEIQRHNLSTFMHEQHRAVMIGCSFCRKHFGTVEQFKFHITEDVLPPLLDKTFGGNNVTAWQFRASI
jgi:hypothetical protein